MTTVTTEEALSGAIFALNTLANPDASAPADVEWLDEHTEAIVALLADLRHEHRIAAEPEPEVIVMLVLDDTELTEADDPDDYPPEDEVEVVCPHKGCGGTEFYEVDRAERWNPMTLYVGDEEGGTVERATVEVDELMFVTSDGDNGDGYATDHYLCQTCQQRVSIPEWISQEWS